MIEFGFARRVKPLPDLRLGRGGKGVSKLGCGDLSPSDPGKCGEALGIVEYN